MSTMSLNDQLPARDGNATVNSANRLAVRRWIIAQGARSSQVISLPNGTLASIYNDLTDSALRNLIASGSDYADTATDKTKPAPQASGDASQALANAIAAIAAGVVPQQAPIDEERIIDLIRTHAPQSTPRELSITVGYRPAVVVDRQHYKFPLLLATIAARIPAYLVGPAGTGKTTAAEKVAEVLSLPYYAISIGPMTSKGDLFGMRDAHGVYHESDLVKSARDGGVFLFDEFDAGNAAVLTAINMLLANGQFATPAGMLVKHPDFVPIFALNTYGNGASSQYVGRQQLDAATLDRGGFIHWPLDEGLESSFLGIDESSPAFELTSGGTPKPADWLRRVRKFRSGVEAAGVRHVVSPRAVLFGMRLAAAGVGADHIEKMLLHKGLDDTALAKIAA